VEVKECGRNGKNGRSMSNKNCIAFVEMKLKMNEDFNLDAE
jgi:hypothetical protein